MVNIEQFVSGRLKGRVLQQSYPDQFNSDLSTAKKTLIEARQNRIHVCSVNTIKSMKDTRNFHILREYSEPKKQ